MQPKTGLVAGARFIVTQRVALGLSLAAVLAAMACGRSSSSGSGGTKGVAQGTFTLTVQNGQNGNTSLAITRGYVTSTPGGIDCGVAPHGACSGDFPSGSTVTLTAHPDTTTTPPNEVLLWAGDCSGMAATCSVSGAADQYVVVVFGTEPERTAHSNFTDPTVHGPAWDAYTAGAPGALDCVKCHGANMQGQGIAVDCDSCHTWPVSATGQLGSAGGIVALSGGATLTVGANALAAPTTLTITNTTTYPQLPPDTTLLGPVYDFAPNGQAFSTPITVSFPIPAGTTDATVLWTDSSGSAFQDIGGTVVGSTVQAQVSHFSKGGAASRTKFTLGGTVSGVTGTGLVLRNNGGSDLAVVADGPFAFAAKLASGAAYSVAVAQQPSSPAQTCTVSNGTGVVSGPVNDIAVTCVSLSRPIIASFSASPPALNVGQATTLSWSVSGATSLTVNGVTVAGSSVSVSPTVTTTYVLVAEGPGGTATASAVVTVNALALVGFDASSGRTQVYLIWFTPGAASTSQVLWGTTPQLGNATAVNTSLVTDHNMSVGGLALGTTYYFQAVSVDALGREAKSSIISKTTLP